MASIQVNVPGGSYAITIEPGALARLGKLVAELAPSPSALLAADLKIAGTHGAVAAQSLRAAGYDVHEIGLDADESAKSMATIGRIHGAMFDGGLERSSPVIALGGGVVGDTAGFAAAIYMRGVPLIQVPTTLLSMVDAAIGGKTGVNFTPGGDGVEDAMVKNLIGAFHQPRAVLVDPRVLSSLPPREFRCGLAECVKHGLISDSGLLTLMERDLDAILKQNEGTLVELIQRSARVKVAIVQEDERESGRRALLNLGHTFAHVIEPLPEQGLKHGEAVAIGLRAAMACAIAMGRADAGELDRLTTLLERIALPTCLRVAASPERLIDAMRHDKKVAQGKVRLVLPLRGGGAELVSDVPRGAIEAGWNAVRVGS